MDNLQVPYFCKPCVTRLQAQCPHTHTSFHGGYHFSAGDVWDDVTEICIDCGANLDELLIHSDSILDIEEITF